MTFVTQLPGYKVYDALKESAFRMGVYVGICVFVVFAGWIIVANRMSWLSRFALERNVLAAAAFCLLAVLPILRFRRRPASLLGSGLVAWTVFSFLYRLLALYFSSLSEWHSTTQVFVIGALAYLISATIAWIVGFVLRVRATHAEAEQNHQLS
jgi:hypothetical protein